MESDMKHCIGPQRHFFVENSRNWYVRIGVEMEGSYMGVGGPLPPPSIAFAESGRCG